MKKMIDQFNNYVKTVHPLGIHETQTIELRRAFFAGANIMLVNMIMVSEMISEDHGIKAVETLRDECIAFSDDVKAGKY